MTIRHVCNDCDEDVRPDNSCGCPEDGAVDPAEAASALVEQLRGLAIEARAVLDRCAETAILLAADAVEAGAVPRLLADRFEAWPGLDDSDPPSLVARARCALKGA